MSETLSQPESATSRTQAEIARALRWIETTENDLELVRKARQEAVAYYEIIVRDSLKDQEITFSGPIEKGVFEGDNGPTWAKRWDTFKDQRAKVEYVSVTHDQNGDIQTTAWLKLVGGDRPDWDVSVLLENVEWNLMEEEE